MSMSLAPDPMRKGGAVAIRNGRIVKRFKTFGAGYTFVRNANKKARKYKIL
jgi:hypothetical protein